MEVYLEARKLFPQLPGELWERIMWFVLRGLMEDKLSTCFPMFHECDVMEEYYDCHPEDRVADDWDGHSHTTIMANNVLHHDSVLCYDHVFYTDCCMWIEREHELTLEDRASDVLAAIADVVYYRTHTFGLIKKRKDGVAGNYRVNYITHIYVDGTARLVAQEYE